MMKYDIREMREEDIPGILRLEHLSFPTPWTEWMFLSQLKIADLSVNLVLVDGSGVAAYAVAWVVHDEIHLLSIAVTPAKRRRKYGRAILEEVIARGRMRGGTHVILEVREGNEAARDFYRTMGFHKIGRRRRYYIDTGEDAYVMELVLESEKHGKSAR
jgi:ribosomal-protein-alanine N-acetyltransferase